MWGCSGGKPYSKCKGNCVARPKRAICGEKPANYHTTELLCQVFEELTINTRIMNIRCSQTIPTCEMKYIYIYIYIYIYTSQLSHSTTSLATPNQSVYQSTKFSPTRASSGQKKYDKVMVMTRLQWSYSVLKNIYTCTKYWWPQCKEQRKG